MDGRTGDGLLILREKTVTSHTELEVVEIPDHLYHEVTCHIQEEAEVAKLSPFVPYYFFLVFVIVSHC